SRGVGGSVMTLSRWALGLAVALSFAGPLSAHDLRTGKHMGFPPRSSDMDRRLAQLIPADLDQQTRAELKGVLDRAKVWPQNKELMVCFLSGTPKARARVAAAALEWTKYVNLRLNFGDMENPRTCSGDNSEQIKVDFKPDGYWSYVGVESLQFAH